jgi:hypothetical protein
MDIPLSVASAEADPLGKGTVLVLLLSKNLLDLEGLVGGLEGLRKIRRKMLSSISHDIPKVSQSIR